MTDFVLIPLWTPGRRVLAASYPRTTVHPFIVRETRARADRVLTLASETESS